MKMNFRNPALLLIFFCLLAIAACKKDRVTWDGEITSTVDHSFADSEFAAIRNMVDTEGTADSSIYGKTSGTTGLFCPTSSVSVTITGVNTARMVIDFGTGANCLDGRLRSGKLNADFTGKWKDAGSTVVITPDGYTVSGYAFSFTATTTVNPRNSSGKLNWTTAVDNAVLSSTNGTINWEGTRTTTWVEGEGSLDVQTYAYEVTGSANGVARNGLSFAAQVDQPLRIEMSCSNIVSGVFSITPQDREKRSIDYGDGTCDNQATLSVGQFSTQFTLY